MDLAAATPSARLLDISRLVSRAGRILTGVDRVELAYLRRLLNEPVPLYAISRTAVGYVLLDANGARKFLGSYEAQEWGNLGIISRLSFRADEAAKKGQNLARRHAISRCRNTKVGAMLRRALPAGLAYINVGHSNLTEHMLAAVRGCSGARITVIVHDTIPLDFPHFQRPGTVLEFENKLRRVASYADQVICVSVAGLHDVSRHMRAMGRVPPMVPAHIGVDVAQPVSGSIPAGFDLTRPYFVTVGTIEPRKNHALLLDIWNVLGTDAPNLFICDHRGWLNDTVFDRLDAGMPNVIEVADMPDGALSALISGARGLLFPSFAKGFGLPPVEAAALGVPVICNDLAVYGEVLGERAVYVNATDRYQREKAIKRLAETDDKSRDLDYVPPRWDGHFKIVLTLT